MNYEHNDEFEQRRRPVRREGARSPEDSRRPEGRGAGGGAVPGGADRQPAWNRADTGRGQRSGPPAGKSIRNRADTG